MSRYASLDFITMVILYVLETQDLNLEGIQIACDNLYFMGSKVNKL